jgi:hypothetical protein
MDVSSQKLLKAGATGLLRLARSLLASATSLCPVLVYNAIQYRQIRSLIQTEAQTYRILPLIPNPTSPFLVQQANGEVHEIVFQGLVIKAGKDWFELTLMRDRKKSGER